MRGHDPADLAHLEHQRVDGHELERSRVLQSAGAELLYIIFYLLCHLSNLTLIQRIDPQLLHQLIQPTITIPPTNNKSPPHYSILSQLSYFTPTANRGNTYPGAASAPICPRCRLGCRNPCPDLRYSGTPHPGWPGDVSRAAYRICLYSHQRLDESVQQLTLLIKPRLCQLLLYHTIIFYTSLLLSSFFPSFFRLSLGRVALDRALAGPEHVVEAAHLVQDQGIARVV